MLCGIFSKRAPLAGCKSLCSGSQLKQIITPVVNADSSKARELIKKAEVSWLIYNSMKARVSLEAAIVEERAD
jgi:hypothetical protein